MRRLTARYELIEWILGRWLRGVDVDPSSRERGA